MWDSLIAWLETHLFSCWYVETFGMEGPGCGMQRALIALLRGDIVESLTHNPALIPTLFTFLYLPAHLIFKFRRGAAILKYSFIFTASLLVVNFILKQLN